MTGNGAAELREWLEEHDEDFHELAERMHVRRGLVRIVALMVLSQVPDDEIYESLRDALPSPDGQRSPLAGIPELLTEVRQLVELGG